MLPTAATCYVRMLRFLDYVCSRLLFRALQYSLLIPSSCRPLHAVSESKRPICPSVSCAQIVASSVCASLHFRLRTRFTFRTLPYYTITLGINSPACTALSTLGITSQLLASRLTSVLHHNAANFSGVTQGCDRRPFRLPAKPLVYIYCIMFHSAGANRGQLLHVYFRTREEGGYLCGNNGEQYGT